MTTRKQRGIWVSVISLIGVGFGPLSIKEGDPLLFGDGVAEAGRRAQRWAIRDPIHCNAAKQLSGLPSAFSSTICGAFLWVMLK